MPINVLQLGPYPPPEGGITRNMLSIRDRLRHRGDSCSIIATSKSAQVVTERDVHHPRSAAELVSLVRRIDHDILHLHVGGNITRRVLSLAVAAATFGTRPVLTMHSGGYPKTSAAQNARPTSARGRIFRRFTRVIAVNDELADVFRRYGLGDGQLATIAPFALEPPDSAVALRADLAAFVASHSPLLVSVGGLEPDYEPLFLIDAMRDVTKEFPDAGLIIVGDGSMRGSVEKAIREDDCSDAICLAASVSHAETLHLISRADAMLRITLFDGDAISVREAMFLGTPVIATDNRMRPVGVRLIDPGDRAEFLQQIRSVVGHTREISHDLSPDYSNIDRVLELYDSLL